jgi:hypothetical protein
MLMDNVLVRTFALALPKHMSLICIPSKPQLSMGTAVIGTAESTSLSLRCPAHCRLDL